jgi:hypothetical protein
MWVGASLTVIAAMILAGLVMARAARMTLSRWPIPAADVAANLAVAAAYDVARALSLIMRATHRTRHQASGAPGARVVA